MEMVDSVDELKSSQSIAGKNFQDFEMLDARNASALNKTTQNNSHLKGSQFRGAESSQKRIGFCGEDRSPS